MSDKNKKLTNNKPENGKAAAVSEDKAENAKEKESEKAAEATEAAEAAESAKTTEAVDAAEPAAAKEQDDAAEAAEEKAEKASGGFDEKADAPADDTAASKPAAKGKSFNPFKNKKLRYGGLSVLFTIIFIVAVVLTNVIVTMLGERFSVEADLTDAGLYTIEKESADYLGTIDDDVTLTVTSEEEAFTGTGTYFYQTNEILKKIANCNGRIGLEYVDVIKNPGFESKYSEKITQNQIIIESKKTGRVKVLNYDDYLSITYDENYLQYGMYQIKSVEANCEQSVVSAIMNVTDTDPVKVAVITGYGETENTTLKSLLETNSYIVESIDITLTDKIGDDVDFVILSGPDKDYSLDDINKIDAWLDNGGKFDKNLVYIANPALGESTNIDGLLSDWGLSVQKGTLYQTDAKYAYATKHTYQVLATPETDYAEFTNDAAIYGDNLCPVVPLWDAYSNMQTQYILRTYDGATIKPQNSGDNWEPEGDAYKTSYGVVVQSVKSRFEGVVPHQSRIIAIGGTELLNSYFLAAPQANNAQLIMNIFNISCNKESGITLTPKSYNYSTYEITEAQKMTLNIIFIFVLPLSLIVAGIVIWLRRCHK